MARKIDPVGEAIIWNARGRGYGKGDRPRKGFNWNAYRDNFDEIFGKKKQNASKIQPEPR